MKIFTQLSAYRDDIEVTFYQKCPNGKTVYFRFPIKLSEIEESFEKADEDSKAMKSFFINEFKPTRQFREIVQ